MTRQWSVLPNVLPPLFHDSKPNFTSLAGDHLGRYSHLNTTSNYCEEDYAQTIYIAEFWNAVSALIYIYFAFYPLDLKIQYLNPRTHGTVPHHKASAPGLDRDNKDVLPDYSSALATATSVKMGIGRGRLRMLDDWFFLLFSFGLYGFLLHQRLQDYAELLLTFHLYWMASATFWACTTATYGYVRMHTSKAHQHWWLSISYQLHSAHGGEDPYEEQLGKRADEYAGYPEEEKVEVQYFARWRFDLFGLGAFFPVLLYVASGGFDAPSSASTHKLSMGLVFSAAGAFLMRQILRFDVRKHLVLSSEKRFPGRDDDFSRFSKAPASFAFKHIKENADLLCRDTKLMGIFPVTEFQKGVLSTLLETMLIQLLAVLVQYSDSNTTGCMQLRSLRRDVLLNLPFELGRLLAPLTQMHAWWHILSAIVTARLVALMRCFCRKTADEWPVLLEIFEPADQDDKRWFWQRRWM